MLFDGFAEASVNKPAMKQISYPSLSTIIQNRNNGGYLLFNRMEIPIFVQL